MNWVTVDIAAGSNPNEVVVDLSRTKGVAYGIRYGWTGDCCDAIPKTSDPCPIASCTYIHSGRVFCTMELCLILIREALLRGNKVAINFATCANTCARTIPMTSCHYIIYVYIYICVYIKVRLWVRHRTFLRTPSSRTLLEESANASPRKPATSRKTWSITAG